MIPGSYYVYVEYCPGPFYWGWWFYSAPIQSGLPDRTRSHWLTRCPRDRDAIMDALGLPRVEQYGGYEKEVEEFMVAYPNGVVVTLGASGAYTLGDQADCWKHLKHVREQQMMDWRHDREADTEPNNLNQRRAAQEAIPDEQP